MSDRITSANDFNWETTTPSRPRDVAAVEEVENIEMMIVDDDDDIAPSPLRVDAVTICSSIPTSFGCFENGLTDSVVAAERTSSNRAQRLSRVITSSFDRGLDTLTDGDLVAAVDERTIFGLNNQTKKMNRSYTITKPNEGKLCCSR